ALYSRGFGSMSNPTVQASSKVWQVLEQTLRGASRVYLSPDGVLNQTSFFAWKGSDGHFLIENDNLDLRPVSSTAVLLDKEPNSTANSALLVGNPDFDHPAEANPSITATSLL